MRLGAAHLIKITEPVAGIHLVRIPIPAPLRYVNAYLLAGADGWTIVDTGFHTADAERTWDQAFAALGIGPGDVAAIIVTHFHPDHYGAAGWLQERTGAPVVMLDREIATVARVWQPACPEELAAFARRHGAPADAVEQIAGRSRRTQSEVQPPPRLTPVAEGERLRLGGRTFDVLWTPGHSPGLMVLVDRERRIALVNDMVLARISPNVSAGPHQGPDPLGEFLASLRRVAELPVDLALTGHGAPVRDLRGRCRELLRHHEERLGRALAAVSARRGGATAWEVARDLFGGVMDTPANLGFALGEAAAHLDHLVAAGRLNRVEESGAWRYVKR